MAAQNGYLGIMQRIALAANCEHVAWTSDVTIRATRRDGIRDCIIHSEPRHLQKRSRGMEWSIEIAERANHLQ